MRAELWVKNFSPLLEGWESWISWHAVGYKCSYIPYSDWMWRKKRKLLDCFTVLNVEHVYVSCPMQLRKKFSQVFSNFVEEVAGEVEVFNHYSKRKRIQQVGSHPLFVPLIHCEWKVHYSSLEPCIQYAEACFPMYAWDWTRSPVWDWTSTVVLTPHLDPPPNQLTRSANIRLCNWLGYKRAYPYIPNEDSPELGKNESKEWGTIPTLDKILN